MTCVQLQVLGEGVGIDFVTPQDSSSVLVAIFARPVSQFVTCVQLHVLGEEVGIDFVTPQVSSRVVVFILARPMAHNP